MSNRLIPALLLAALVYALGASFVGFASLPVAKATVHAASEPAIPVLPTVVVRPESEPVLLGVITVRPTAEDRAAAEALEAQAALVGTVVAMRARGGGMLPRPSFDMPYYSFGKSAYRVTKE